MIILHSITVIKLHELPLWIRAWQLWKKFAAQNYNWCPENLFFSTNSHSLTNFILSTRMYQKENIIIIYYGRESIATKVHLLKKMLWKVYLLFRCKVWFLVNTLVYPIHWTSVKSCYAIKLFLFIYSKRMPFWMSTENTQKRKENFKWRVRGKSTQFILPQTSIYEKKIINQSGS